MRVHYELETGQGKQKLRARKTQGALGRLKLKERHKDLHLFLSTPGSQIGGFADEINGQRQNLKWSSYHGMSILGFGDKEDCLKVAPTCEEVSPPFHGSSLNSRFSQIYFSLGSL